MGKAIYGVLGGPDPRTVAELASLRARVRQLEDEVAQLRAAALVETEIDLALLSSNESALV